MRVLDGLEGSNPLGFLAGLGVINVLTDRLPTNQPPRLGWRPGDWRAVLELPENLGDDELVRTLREDQVSWQGDPCLELRYHKPNKSGKAGALAWDLKPPDRKYREYVESLLTTAAPQNRRGLDFAAAFATETARDNNQNTKPTALHFTAGQQEFLRMVGELAIKVTEPDFREALFGPWRYAKDLPVLGWDCSVSRDYALRASDPSKDKKLGVPGADWLAFRGLSFIRVAPKGTQILTTGCTGGWKTGRFTWPLWGPPLERDTIQALLQRPSPSQMNESIRHARGIIGVFSSAIRRSDQGGYGTFSPSAGL